MGTCLAVIKTVGVTTLGLYAGAVTTNVLSTHEVLSYVLSATSTSTATATGLIKSKLSCNGLVLTVLGAASSAAFQLAYFGAPEKYQHPYLIYSALVFPVSSFIYALVARRELLQLFRGSNESTASASTVTSKKAKKNKEDYRSELDNSVYKDLGDSSSVDEHAEEEEEQEQDTAEQDVDAHLNKIIAQNALDATHLANKIVAIISTVGFVIATVGVHGDY